LKKAKISIFQLILAKEKSIKFFENNFEELLIMECEIGMSSMNPMNSQKRRAETRLNILPIYLFFVHHTPFD